jgi:ABC-2 type transport system ATP-binding protein
MTVRDYLHFVSSLKLTPKEKRDEQVDRVMDLVKIAHVQGRLVKNLSKGYKQRVGLAQALMGSPEVLVLDEPTAGLDPTQIVEMRKTIRQLGKEHTIILSSHILPEVSAVCDRIVIINKGEIAAIDTPANLSKIFAHSTKFTVRIAGPKATVKGLISGLAGVSSVSDRNTVGQNVTDYLVETTSDTDVRRPLFFEMAKNGYPILELRSMSMSLEEIFMQVVTEEKEAVES